MLHSCPVTSNTLDWLPYSEDPFRYGVWLSPAEIASSLTVGYMGEADSWRDFQRLDHLESKRDRLLQLLDAVS